MASKLQSCSYIKGDKTTSDMSLSKKRCDRKVYGNKYERNAPEIRNWWYELFDILEADASIPADKKIEVLNRVFPADILLRVLSILSVKSVKFKEALEETPKTHLDSILLKRGAEYLDIESSVQMPSLPSNKSHLESKERREMAEEIDTKQSKESLGKVIKQQQKNTFPKASMYMNFFKRKEHRAAVWRTLPPLTMEEMNLNQKADAIAKKIATEFVDWITKLGGDEDSPIDVQGVIGLFEIGFDAPVATSLKVQLKEMPSLPQKVADARGMPQLSKRAVLHQEIKRDHKATKRKPRLMAFGRRLPTDMQIRPQKEISTQKWLSCDKVPEDLSTMAAVWEGITHLKSTRAFCQFLLKKPEVKPPKYLIDCKMMDKKVLEDEDTKAATKERQQNIEFSRKNVKAI